MEEDKEQERKEKNFNSKFIHIHFLHYLFLCDGPSSIFYKTFSNLLLSSNPLIHHILTVNLGLTQRNWEILENFCPNS